MLAVTVRAHGETSATRCGWLRSRRSAHVGAALGGMAVAVLLAAAPASAEVCTTSGNSGADRLPLTGLPVFRLAVFGAVLVVVGVALLVVARRPMRAPVGRMALVLVVVLGVAVIFPQPALAAVSAATPCSTVPDITTGQTVDPSAAPPAVLPEAPLPAVMPLAGAGVAALVLLRRHRKMRRSDARQAGIDVER